MLKNAEKTEIAELSGFNSLSTFNRAFVKKVGETPARYIKKLNRKEVN